MKILLATTAITQNGGGIASYNNELISALKANNVFHLITTENISSYKSIERIYSLPSIKLKNFSDYKSIIQSINQEKYELIINSDSSLITIISPFLTSPIITISHTFNNMPAIEAGFNHKYVNKIVALSKAGKNFLEKYFSIKDKEKIHSIYNFIKNENQPLDEKKYNQKILKIVFPGGASMMKYPEMVLFAVNRLLETNLNFKFYWLGNLTLPLAKISIPKKINELVQHDSRLIFTNKISRPEAITHIKSANIFILPSRAEGCPMSLIEALTTGCIPVVGSARHVCREIMEDGNFGVIVKQGSSKDLYNKLVNIISHHENYIENYSKTYNYSKTVLSEDAWVKKMSVLINDSIKTRKAVLPLSLFSFYSSFIRFKFHANKMLLKDRLLSLWGFMKFNTIYLICKHHEN